MSKLKGLLKSKTFWFNALSIAILILGYLAENGILSIQIQTLLVAIGNILLRTVTNVPVENKSSFLKN